MPSLSFQTALGLCRIEWNDAGLAAFRLPELDAAAAFPESENTSPSWVHQLAGRVQKHLEGELQDFSDATFDFSLVSSFQRAVYEGALAVKPGQTQSYGWLARKIGQPVFASRAIGTALGQNPWPLLVPCHRFIGASGKMVGFSGPGGIQTKLRLLALEGAMLDL